MIFVIRHGERADFSYNPKEKIRIIKEYDPPLSHIGLKQSAITGAYINKFMKKLSPKHKIPIIITSPFLRCLETAISIAESFDSLKGNTIFLEDSLGEYMQRTWFSDNIVKDLTIKNSHSKQFTQKFELKNGFLDKSEANELKPEYPEDFIDFYKRIQKSLSQISKKFFKEFNIDEYYLIIVTHGYAIEVLLGNFAALQKLQISEYCSVTLLKYFSLEKYEVLLSTSNSHLQSKL